MVMVLVMVMALLLASLTVQGTQAATYRLYQDMQQPVEVRVKDLLGRMTLAEKIGQMTQTERTVTNHTNIRDFGLGAFLEWIIDRVRYLVSLNRIC